MSVNPSNCEQQLEDYHPHEDLYDYDNLANREGGVDELNEMLAGIAEALTWDGVELEIYTSNESNKSIVESKIDNTLDDENGPDAIAHVNYEGDNPVLSFHFKEGFFEPSYDILQEKGIDIPTAENKVLMNNELQATLDRITANRGNAGVFLLNDLSQIQSNTYEISTDEKDELEMGLKEDVSYWRKIGGAISLASNSISQLKIPERTWKSDDVKYPDCFILLGQFPAGVGDGVVDELKSIPELIALGGMVFTDEATRNQIGGMLSDLPGVASKMIDTAIENYSNPVTRYHQGGKDGVAIGFMFLGPPTLGPDFLAKLEPKLASVENVSTYVGSPIAKRQKGVELDMAHMDFAQPNAAVLEGVSDIAVTNKRILVEAAQSSDEMITALTRTDLPPTITKNGELYHLVEETVADLADFKPIYTKQPGLDDLIDSGKIGRPRTYKKDSPNPNPDPDPAPVPLPRPLVVVETAPAPTGCNVCMDKSAAIKELYRLVCIKAGGTEVSTTALNKICSLKVGIPNQIKLLDIGNILISDSGFTPFVLNRFFLDILDPNEVTNLTKLAHPANILLFDGEEVEAWKVLYDISNDIGSTWKTDFSTLSKLGNDMDANADLKQFLVDNSDHFSTWNGITTLSSYRGSPIAIKEIKRLSDDFDTWNISNNWAAKSGTVYYHLLGHIQGNQKRGGHLISELGIGWGSRVRVINNSGLPQFDNTVTNISDIAKSNLAVNSNGVIKVDPYLNQEFFIAKYQGSNQGPNFNVIVKYVKKPLVGANGQTFFPDNMTYQEIIEQIASSRANTNILTWQTPNNWSIGKKALSESGIMIRWFDNGSQPPTSYFPEF